VDPEGEFWQYIVGIAIPTVVAVYLFIKANEPALQRTPMSIRGKSGAELMDDYKQHRDDIGKACDETANLGRTLTGTISTIGIPVPKVGSLGLTAGDSAYQYLRDREQQKEGQ
jgi:hypothetical protein